MASADGGAGGGAKRSRADEAGGKSYPAATSDGFTLSATGLALGYPCGLPARELTADMMKPLAVQPPSAIRMWGSDLTKTTGANVMQKLESTGLFKTIRCDGGSQIVYCNSCTCTITAVDNGSGSTSWANVTRHCKTVHPNIWAAADAVMALGSRNLFAETAAAAAAAAVKAASAPAVGGAGGGGRAGGSGAAGASLAAVIGKLLDIFGIMLLTDGQPAHSMLRVGLKYAFEEIVRLVMGDPTLVVSAPSYYKTDKVMVKKARELVDVIQAQVRAHATALYEGYLPTRYALLVDKWLDAAGNEILGIVIRYIDA
jgi:hypothetical protein